MMKRAVLLLCIFLSSVSIWAQEMPDKSSDTWYWCTYGYRYTSLPNNKKDYIESKEQNITTAINAFRLIMNLDYSVYALKGAPASLVWDDKKGCYKDDENTFMLSSDFVYLTLMDEGDTDVFRLLNCYEAYDFEEDKGDEEELVLWEDSDDDEQEKAIGWKHYLLYILLALLPAIALLVFILWRDRLRPEPAKELILACVMGLLSVPIALLLGKILMSIGLFTGATDTWKDCFKMAFFGAAIPEEMGKLIILWLFFKWRKIQNEFMDGIVYAACIGLAFAAYENIGYVLHSLQLQSIYSAPLALSTSITRALMSVPGHFGFAVMMGFFFSFYLFDRKRKGLFLALAFLVPMLFHGLYDTFAFMERISPVWVSVVSFLFFLTFFVMNNLCIKAIRTAVKLDDAAMGETARIQPRIEDRYPEG